jgi:hypothetical protein
LSDASVKVVDLNPRWSKFSDREDEDAERVTRGRLNIR